ncbi:urease accessory protein [Siculibacillus lacustris]|uniref:Urease accessory protein UreD n=1 Tax=Siculibacillus lacustris TaxID=1549641 RepID=A0A4Q9VGB6_9HYPH|nr:urease accessory protein UreD [Siculibacillus lacustris]TBW33942.1 urease accessory protein [Siculibacillus lacustris]
MTPVDAPPFASVPLVLERARGRAEIGFAQTDGVTRLDRLYQEGQAKIRLPKSHGGVPPTAVFINTGGGIAGGDRLAWSADFGPGTRAVVTSQAAERVYRSSKTDGSLAGEIDNRITVAAGAEAEWLPQETILFEGAALTRRLEVDVAADARLLAVESTVFGRSAMGEEVTACRLVDRWRLRRAGRLVWADTFRVEGAARDILAGTATGAGARAFATIVMVAPDAEARLDGVREVLETETCGAGASAFDGLLLVRMADPSARVLRDALIRTVVHIRQAEMPRVWSC